VTASLTSGGLPVGEEKTRRVREMFDTIAPRYQMVNRLMTLGLDARWRRRTVRSLGLPASSTVLDVATGTGDLAAEARRQGHCVVGVDLSIGMLAADRDKPAAAQCDAAALPLSDRAVDGVLCGYALRNFTDLRACLAEMARVLRPGGRVALLEVSEPPGGLTRMGFEIWFNRVVPLIGGTISDRDAYQYLPKSVAYLPGTDELRAMLRDVGFSGVNRQLLSGGLSQLVTATRKGAPS